MPPSRWEAGYARSLRWAFSAQSVGVADSILESRVAYAMAGTVRRRRESLGMTQEQLSLASGVNRSTIQDLESGHSDHKSERPANPRMMTILRLADALDLPVSELLEPVQERYDFEKARLAEESTQ